MTGQPHELCGASMVDDKRCQRVAGWMTNHLGEGRCYEHGGLGKPSQDVFRNALESHGLGGVMDLAESLSFEEAQYIQHMSSAALVAIRAKLVAQMLDDNRSPKEMSEISLALRRVEASISALEDGKPMGLTDPDAVERDERAEEERKRLSELSEKFSVESG